MPEALLCDIDGVLVSHPDALFSVRYAKAHGFDVGELSGFFKGDFNLALMGQRSLEEVLSDNRSAWHLRSDDDIRSLIEQWSRDHGDIHDENVAALRILRKRGVVCCAATNQERARGEWLTGHLFEGLFDQTFISANVGFKKPSSKYFEYVLNQLQANGIIKTPEKLSYIDDELENVTAALELGIRAHHYDGSRTVAELLGVSDSL